jgi:DNA invertase Pin-like site-specific DNA recombinase
MTKPVVAYIRVSTARQGRSGLGLEAQQGAIGRFCEAEGRPAGGEGQGPSAGAERGGEACAGLQSAGDREG